MMEDLWMMEQSDGILKSGDFFQRINGSKRFSDLDGCNCCGAGDGNGRSTQS